MPELPEVELVVRSLQSLVVGRSVVPAQILRPRLIPGLSSDSFTADYLKSVMTSSRRSIKEALLDQSRVVGVGNIYAAEVLFRARVRPTALAARLSRVRIDRIRGAILDILGDAVANGSTLRV